MECFELIGPIGVVKRGDTVYQYYKNERDVLVEEKIKKRIRVFVVPEKKDKALEELKKLGIGEEIKIISDVVYVDNKVHAACLFSIPVEDKNLEELKLKLKKIPGVIGIEKSVSNFRKQEFLLSRLEETDFSREFGYFLKTKMEIKKDGNKLIASDILQEKPKTKEEVLSQLENLKKKLVFSTVDYETWENQIVMATVMRSDGFSKTIIVNKDPEIEREFKKFFSEWEIEVVQDEKSLIKKVYEYRKAADIEMIHGSSILEKQKDCLEFPSTKERPKDKFDVAIYFRPFPPLRIVTPEGIMPSIDSLYSCKYEKAPTKRSLEDILDYYFGDKETLKKTDYKKFKVYTMIKSKEDLEMMKKDVEETLTHNIRDSIAHLKLTEFLLFDQKFLILPMLFSIDLETIFKKTVEEIGEAIFTSQLLQKRIFSKMCNERTKLSKNKESIVSRYDKVLTEEYGKRIEGRWLYPSFGFVPQIILENKDKFEEYVVRLFEDLFRMKGGLGVFGVNEESGKHEIFDPYSFAINCGSAHLLFGRKVFTSEEYSSQIFKCFSEIYNKLSKSRELEGCEIVYLSPFKSRIFISGEPEKTMKSIEEVKKKLPFFLTDYNKHKDIFIPLNKKQAIATESGKIIKIGWRGSSKSDPKVVREAVDRILEKLMSYGLNEAKKEMDEQMKKIECLEYQRGDYKISSRLTKQIEKYKKETFRLKLLKEAYNEYMRKFKKEPSGFVDFFVTENGIEFAENPENQIDGKFYVEYLKERLKPLLPLFKIEICRKNSTLTSYMK